MTNPFMDSNWELYQPTAKQSETEEETKARESDRRRGRKRSLLAGCRGRKRLEVHFLKYVEDTKSPTRPHIWLEFCPVCLVSLLANTGPAKLTQTVQLSPVNVVRLACCHGNTEPTCKL